MAAAALLLALLAALLLLAAPARGDTYVNVGASCAAACDGSAGTPVAQRLAVSQRCSRFCDYGAVIACCWLTISPANPYTSIPPALAAGGTIHVAAGTYTGTGM